MPRDHHSSHRQKNAGFTLVELAIVVLIAGLLLVAAIAVALPVLRHAQVVQTQAKLANIAKALDFYATQNYRVPCPSATVATAANFGFENGSAGACLITRGVVPFRTLNIPVDWARDAWGNYITYAISPDFSLDVNATNIPVWGTIPVHALCRTADWYKNTEVYERKQIVNTPTIGLVPGGVNYATVDIPTATPDVLLHKNPRKARFCCPGFVTNPAGPTDLIIKDVNGNAQIAIGRETSPTTPLAIPPYNQVEVASIACGIFGSYTAMVDCSTYQTTDKPYPNPARSNVQVPADQRVAAPVFVLVSHGINGYGAYIGNGAQLAAPVNIATPAERANANLDGGTGRTYYDIPELDRIGLEQNFDDVVLWRTQDMMFAEQGKSCALP